MKYYPAVMPIPFEDLADSELGFKGPDGGVERSVVPIFLSQRADNVVMIGTFGSRVFYTNDNGETWSRILQASQLGGNPRFGLITDHPDEHKSILIVGPDSKVYRSTDLTKDTLADWELVLDGPSSGVFAGRYGWSMHGPIILLATYGEKNAQNPPRHIYLSRDYGGTWQEIEMLSVGEMVDPAHFHIHDVEYDPYAGRIWVATGDQGNGNVYYSDDWGATFTQVFPGRAIQPTTISALPDRVIFGSDDMPNGIRVWKRKPLHAKAPVLPEDIEFVWCPDRIDESVPLRNVANLNHTPRRFLLQTYPWNMLIPMSAASSATTGAARVLATPDGESYFELWRSDLLDPSLFNASITTVMGPVPADPNRTVYILYYHPNVGNRVVRLSMPEWVKMD